MIRPNWNYFENKFSGDEQDAFEWFSYLLFCIEFEQSLGVHGYTNHAGIETDPIETENEVVAFQSKFYGSSSSIKKGDLIDALEKAKANHPNLTKVIFYMNVNFGQRKGGGDPIAKTDTEAKAKELDLNLEWRLANFFKSEFVVLNNAKISSYFFGDEKSIIELIQHLRIKTEEFLNKINSEIDFAGKKIKLDYNESILSIRNKDSSSLKIISGQGGVGKTGLIKDLKTELEEEKVPLFLFKPNEFNIEKLSEVIGFENIGIEDFLDLFQEKNEKYIVIDSAERISDIENREVIEKFIKLALEADWDILFTCRERFVKDLQYIIKNVFNQHFVSYKLEVISLKKLQRISEKYGFALPENSKLKKLLRTPFYLNEYLNDYDPENKNLVYETFKDRIWKKLISHSTYREDKREHCFLELVHERAKKESFYITGEKFDTDTLLSLQNDAIIGFDNKRRQYYIAHDIYEELALERILEIEFARSHDATFISRIGDSLSIRRAFRTWLSKKLKGKNNREAVSLVENLINKKDLDDRWKDEILVSVLLSDYSKTFLSRFENLILQNESELLKRILFLLRIACKKNSSINSYLDIPYLFNEPFGDGWGAVINFLFEKKDELDLNFKKEILPVLNDWNKVNHQGGITRTSSLLALNRYLEITKGNGVYGKSKFIEGMIETILFGSMELKNELSGIIDSIIETQNTSHMSPHYQLAKHILTDISSGHYISKALPEKVIELANLYWAKEPTENRHYYEVRDLENHFGLNDKYEFNYFPASAFQTPILALLRYSPYPTLDFIIDFVNRSIEHFSKERLGKEVSEIELHVSEDEIITQFACQRFWNTYRGSGTVMPYLLQSIHMALEKWLLGIKDIVPTEKLEEICLDLLRKSKSVSITAVICSIVISDHERLFRIAKILSQTREFFFFDTSRLNGESSIPSLNSLGYGIDYKKDFYTEERIMASKESHRRKQLENIILQYQYFRSEGITEEIAEARKKEIWEILDRYHEKVSQIKEKSERDKTWELYLARMDRRKINVSFEDKDEGIQINFEPEISDELKTFRESTMSEFKSFTDASSLWLWSKKKFNYEETSEVSIKYDEDPSLAFREAKKIEETQQTDSFGNYVSTTLVYSVLIRDFRDNLSEDEYKYCKKMIINTAERIITGEIDEIEQLDSVSSCLSVLPLIYSISSDRNLLELILKLVLINESREVLNLFSSISTNLWEKTPNSAKAIVSGFITLKMKYEEKYSEIRRGYIDARNFEQFNEKIVLDELFIECKSEIKDLLDLKFKSPNAENLPNLSLTNLVKLFKLLPIQTEYELYEEYFKKIFECIFPIALDYSNDLDYSIQNLFFSEYTYFLLHQEENKIDGYLSPVLKNFTFSRSSKDLLTEFISKEDALYTYKTFWLIWKKLYPTIKYAAKNPRNDSTRDAIIYTYLLALKWKEDVKNWRSIKEKEREFFRKTAIDIGSHPAVFYAISKFLNDIGSGFLEDGVYWINTIIETEPNVEHELTSNTIYYVEILIKRFIYQNRKAIRDNSTLKKAIMSILDFLVDNGSVTGYMLREDIV
ncbi:MAG: AVAST type 4 anti-phage nuclease Avs4 [Candidatus Paceibacterota bacterium]